MLLFLFITVVVVVTVFLCLPCVLYPMHRNIVSTVTLGCRLDLKDIALRARNAEYNPKVRV